MNFMTLVIIHWSRLDCRLSLVELAALISCHLSAEGTRTLCSWKSSSRYPEIMLPSIVVVSLTFLGVLKLLLLEVLLLMLSLWLMLFLIRAKIGVEGPMYVLTVERLEFETLEDRFEGRWM